MVIITPVVITPTLDVPVNVGIVDPSIHIDISGAPVDVAAVHVTPVDIAAVHVTPVDVPAVHVTPVDVGSAASIDVSVACSAGSISDRRP